MRTDALITASGALALILMIRFCVLAPSKPASASEYDRASLLSVLQFSWVGPTVKKAYSGATIELEDLPGFFYWQRSAFDMLHDHLRDLGGIFFEYCKRGAAGAKSIAEAFTMSSREWAAFCKECKVPVPISELNDTFRRVDRAEKGAKAGTKSDKQLVLGEFIEAIVRLAVKMMLMSAAGRKAVKEGKSAEGLRRLLDSYVLKHAARDSMAQLRLAITDEPTVKAVLDAARVPLTKRFAAAAKRKTEDGMSPGRRRRAAARTRSSRARRAAVGGEVCGLRE